MDIIVTWGNPAGTQITDEFDVLYKIYDTNNSYSWVVANLTPLPSTATSYTITGLDPNVIYRVAITKSCLGTPSILTEDMYVNIVCPQVSVWQGAPQNGYPTLYYSLYYPDSIHVDKSEIFAIDSTVANRFPIDCSAGPTAVVTGRTTYQTSNVCAVGGLPSLLSCSKQAVDFLYPSSLTSAAGYYGLDNIQFFNPPCDGTATDPVLFEIGKTYKFNIVTVIENVQVGFNLTYKTVDETCQNVASADTWLPIVIANNPSFISGASCYDSATGEMSFTVEDGTGKTNIDSYTLVYETNDAQAVPPSITNLPLVDASGTVLTDPHVKYVVYCPISFTTGSSPLVASLLSDGMSFDFYLYNPAAVAVHSQSGLNFAGLTVAQALTAIAADISNATSIVANYVSISGNAYLRIEVPGMPYVSGKIILSGPNILSSGITADLPQNTLATTAQYGVQSGFRRQNASAESIIYGTRAFTGNIGCRIVTSNLTSPGPTPEYNHTIDYPVTKIISVNAPAPAYAYDVKHIGPDNAYYSLGFGLDKTGGTWDEYTYYAVFNGTTNEIVCYDPSGTFYDSDSLTLNIQLPVKYIEVNNAGYLVLICEEDPAAVLDNVYTIQHTALNTYTILDSISVSSSDEIYSSTVTGRQVYTVASVDIGQNSITFTTSLGLNNSYNNFVLEAKTGLEIGHQSILYTYNPLANPPQLNISNDSFTAYIDPSIVVGPAGSMQINLANVSPGDEIVFLNTFSSTPTFIDTSLVAPAYQYYDIMMESGAAVGSRAKIFSVFDSEVRVQQRVPVSSPSVDSWKARTNNYTNFSFGTKYRIYKQNDGAPFYDNVNNILYYSCGNGQVHRIVIGVLGVLSSTTITLLEPNGATPANSSYQMTMDPTTSIIYAVVRDSTVSAVGSPTTVLTSPHIYRINSVAGTALAAINLTAIGGNKAGAISFVQSGLNKYLYLTSATGLGGTRYDLNTNLGVGVGIGAIYTKSGQNQNVGLVHLTGDRFVTLHKMKGNSSLNESYAYDFTNISVIDVNTGTVQVLVGADNTPFGPSSSSVGWNTSSYGEMFGEWNGYKDYGLGGTSIKVYNNKIYRKEYATGRHYVSEEFAETGVGQVWGLGRSYPGNDGSRLIRIWNIQSDGSLVESARTIYAHDTVNGLQRGTDISLAGFENITPYLSGTRVVGVCDNNNQLFWINPADLTGAYGGPPTALYNGTPGAFGYALTSKLAIDTVNPATNKLRGPKIAVINTNPFSPLVNAIYLFGLSATTPNSYVYQVFNIAAVNGSAITPTLSDITADGTNPGLYLTGFNMNYNHLYLENLNEVWVMGNETATCTNPPTCTVYTYGDRIVNVYDADDMSLTATINLTTAGVEATGTAGITGNAWNFQYVTWGGVDAVMYFNPTSNKFAVINASTKQFIYNGLLSTLYNFKRSPQLVVANVRPGWIIPNIAVGSNNAMLLDYSMATTTAEQWMIIEQTTADYEANVHYNLKVTADGTDVYTLNPNGGDVRTDVLSAVTFGHWKVNTDTTWRSLGGAAPSISPNEVIEFTIFNPSIKLIEVTNTNTSTTWSIVTHSNLSTLPTFNTLNSIYTFSIKADSINIFPGDTLEFKFSNPDDSNCPFIRTKVINF